MLTCQALLQCDSVVVVSCISSNLYGQTDEDLASNILACLVTMIGAYVKGSFAHARPRICLNRVSIAMLQEHDTIQNPIHLIGGSHGGDMTSLVYNGHLVTKLEGWAEGGNGIIGLRVTYSNGQVNISDANAHVQHTQ